MVARTNRPVVPVPMLHASGLQLYVVSLCSVEIELMSSGSIIYLIVIKIKEIIKHSTVDEMRLRNMVILSLVQSS